jgi:hypothetical protein
MNNVNEKDKLIFLNFFKGREDYFALQTDDGYEPINQPLSEHFLEKHFKGFVTFGIYVLTKSSQCNFVCIDIDIPKGQLTDIEFEDQEKKYEHLKDKLIIFQKNIIGKLNIGNNAILFEDTGGRGYHIWIFFDEAIPGKDARKLYHIIKTGINLDFEFFPKQSNLTEKRNYGNLIKLPLGIHQKYNRRSTFFTISDSKKLAILLWEKNFTHLQSIKKVKKSEVEQIIKNNETLLGKETILDIRAEKISQRERIYYKDDLNFLFEHCLALNQLKNRAEKNIKLAHTEAFHLVNVILSIPNKEEFLIDIIKKSYDTDFNCPYTIREIELIKKFYPTSCKKLIQEGICGGYCNKSIEEENFDPLLSNTTPLSFWLRPIERKSSIKNEELIDVISSAENIKSAYWKLKKYHEYEDALFFDEFDFKQFEDNLDIYTQYISLYFQQKEEIPFLGYLEVNFPKKNSEDGEVEYRKMAYSTIFDQVIIQSIFNVISIIFEENFQDSSYGYRFNRDVMNANDIFRDWREYYPQFRKNILNENRKSETKYRISCDISKFYDNIRHDILIQQIQKYITDDYIFATVKRIVELYKYDEGVQKGLPQGPAYARILANLYLNKFDEKISQYATGYYRYVDDIFLFFENEKKAKDGLKKVVALLRELDLTLSQDPKKRPKIFEASDEDDLLNYLDTIRYGIFEEFKFMTTLDREKEVQNFYEIVERKTIPCDLQIDSKKIIEINNDIPSIIYLLSKRFTFPIPLKKKIPAIVNYLVENKIFFPKRLKSRMHKIIFYDLINWFPTININLVTFYQNLDNCHKIYFFLCLYYIYTSQKKYEEELKKIILINLKSENSFLRGYAIVFAHKMDMDTTFLNEEYIKGILSSKSYFPKLKLFSCMNYFELSEELRSLFQNYLKPLDNYIIRKYFLSNSSYENVGYSSHLFLSNLTASEGYLLLPECCELFVKIEDKNELFSEFAKVLAETTKYKKLSIKYLKSLLFDLHKDSSKVILENRVRLYNEVQDTELKLELIKVINKIDEELNISEEDNVKPTIYNECILRQYLDEENNVLKYEEIIPCSKLKEYQLNDLDHLKSCLQDLSVNKIIPDINFEFDSLKEEITIRYTKPNDFVDFNSNLFTDNEQGILKLFLVSDNLFKKAQYFYQKLRIIPLIRDNQLFINPLKNEVIFKNIGSILCPRYVIDFSIDINNANPNDIPKLISNIMKKAIFSNEKEYNDFNESSKIGLKLFLYYFIIRLFSSNPYTYPRFHYLISQIKQIDAAESNYKFKLSVMYYYERFKSNLFAKNQEDINWLSICKSLELLYKEIGLSFNCIDFNNVDYRNKICMRRKYAGNFHYLSIQLLNILLNVEDIFKSRKIDCVYTNLVNLLNYYAIFCIEIICLLRSEIKPSDKIIEELPIDKKLTVKINEHSSELSDEDIKIINSLIRLKSNSQDLFNCSVNFNLKQISTLFLFILFDISIKDSDIVIHNNGVLKDKYFKSLYTSFFIRLPDIEFKINRHMNELLNDLKTNQNTVSIDNSVLENDVLTACRDIHAALKSLHIRRFKGKNIHAKKWWPIEIHLQSLFKTVIANRNTIEKIPLVNNCPANTVMCSWDVYNGQVINAVIPNDGVHKLISKLEEGKIFGHKWKFLYLGKAKFIIDLVFSIVLAVIANFLHNITNVPPGSEEPLLYLPFNTIVIGGLLGGSAFFLGKALFVDIKYWSEKISQIIEVFKK